MAIEYGEKGGLKKYFQRGTNIQNLAGTSDNFAGKNSGFCPPLVLPRKLL